MAWLFVNVKLKVLILIEEASPGLVDGVVVLVLLIEESGVVAVGERCLDLDNLSIDLFSDGVGIRPFSLPAAASQTRLQHPDN